MTELKEAGELSSLLPKPSPAAAAAAAAAASSGGDAVRSRVLSIINSHPVVLFMKGTPDNAACGFSERMVDMLKGGNIDFKAFDVLSDSAVREDVKAYSDFPTFPQLYLRGTLVGGVDVIRQLIEESPGKELSVLLGGAPTKEPLNYRLKRLVNSAPSVLFMKGTAQEPRCGFSARAVDVLRVNGLDVSGGSKVFASFDILADPEVREGLKTFSNWPTFPQFYVEGKLIGGLDILKELEAEGELKDMLSGIAPKS
jgi:Grx4 family monothiol glutaredoxin